jgi:DNA topoisomerase-1
MAKSLVIVESPAKARTIKKYLGRGYTVKASLGHVKDLPRRKLGVNVDKNFQPTYFVIPGKEKVVIELREAARKVDFIYLAADPDREGEAICAHLKEVLTDKELPVEPAPANKRGKKKKTAKGKKAKKGAAKKKAEAKKIEKPPVLNAGPPIDKRKKIFRVAMNEITKRGVQQAFEKPAQIDTHLVNAQQARRVLDRLVGYEVSPLLWDKVKRGLSAGRVQTVALRLVVEREQEVRAFKTEEYWTMDANLSAASPPAFDARLVEHQGKKLSIPNQEASDRHLAALRGVSFRVAAVQKKERRRNPVPPFTTSKLQQDSARKLRFSVKRTMMLAQRLYEGIELGEEGSIGLITYMRTDSTRVSQDALDEVRQLIPERYGPKYLPEKARVFKSKKGAQDAHEAVRPTSVSRAPADVKRYLKEDELKVYTLIWQRFIASQMAEALFDQTTIDIAAGDDYRLRATGSVLKFDGFLAVYEEGKDESRKAEEQEESAAARLPEVSEGETLKLNEFKPEQHFTQPPPRYTEATLVKELEEKGIGRPSTYAAILSTILDRAYAAKDRGRFYPTRLGELVFGLLVKSFADIFDIAYTARMEEELDEIEEGKLKWTEALAEFYEKFARDLERAGEEMENVKAGLPTDETCERCSKPLLMRIGRHGLFLACSGYPDCTYTREPTLEIPGIESDENTPEGQTEHCDNCNREMVLKRGRFGAFLACTGYPDCKTTKPLSARGHPSEPVPIGEDCPQCQGQLVEKIGRYGIFIACAKFPECKYTRHKTLGIKCPECKEGEFVERRARKGKRVFYGCSRYPECNFTVGHRPLTEACPECGAAITYEKRSKTGDLRYCRAEKCEFEVPIVPPAGESVPQETASPAD